MKSTETLPIKTWHGQFEPTGQSRILNVSVTGSQRVVHEFIEKAHFLVTNYVNYYGIKISINDFFIIKFQNCNHFCKIKFISILVDRIHIIVEKYKILSFKNDLFSYSIEFCDEFTLISLKDIQYHKKMITFIKKHQIFITKVCEI